VWATFDSRGRVLTTTGPRTYVAQVSKYAYFSDTDADLSRRGQLQTFTDALKHTTTFGNGASPYNTYSPYGIGSTAYIYERRGLLASTVQKVGTAAYTTKYAYDGNGNRISATLPSTRVLTYAFDFADRPYSVKSATAVYVSAATYQPFGPLAQLSFGNGSRSLRHRR
jgi:YD repeat-containing protein